MIDARTTIAPLIPRSLAPRPSTLSHQGRAKLTAENQLLKIAEKQLISENL
jgi:hypothetical protein